ncbi:MAG: hypothetical protein C4297_11280 [Gemmataceae bacterium]
MSPTCVKPLADVLWLPWVGLSLLALVATGCSSLNNAVPVLPGASETAKLPDRHKFRIGHYFVCTDLELDRGHPLLRELEELPEQIASTLRLPASLPVVQVYLFADRSRHEQYMHQAYRELPYRRALFMARGTDPGMEELLVYAHWSDRIQEDLRHELTHAYLHSVLRGIPLWLDEGLAEYFEAPTRSAGMHFANLQGLRAQVGENTWRPDLKRLEAMRRMEEMTASDYREAWLWVHYFLHGPPAVRQAFLDYLQQLRHLDDAGPFSVRLERVLPQPETALYAHFQELDARTRDLSHLVSERTGS